MSKAKTGHDVERLAKLLQESLIDAWVSHNPNHDGEDFHAVKHLGRVGYRHVAAELIKRGVKLPEEKR